MTPPTAGVDPQQGIPIGERFAGLSDTTLRLLRQAALALDRREFAETERALAQAARSAPRHPEVLRLAGLLKHRQKSYAEAAAALRDALAERPGDALTENALGSVLSDVGDIEGAIASFRNACEHAPQFTPAHFNLGQALLSAARVEEAQAAITRGLEIEPTHAGAHVLLARTLKARGDIAAAADAYRRAIGIDPRNARAWADLADLKTVPLTVDEIRTLKQQIQSGIWSDEDRAIASFALAKALDDNGDYANAFAMWSEANELRRRQFGWNAAGFSRHVDAIAAAFAAGSVTPATAADENRGHEIVFIVSLPRSGSTLIEQILSSHPDVEGAGELADLPAIVNEESRRRGKEFPDWVGDATPEDWSRLGQHYLERTARWRGSRPRSTDKLPDNWIHVGAALAMLPGARVVNCRRDPIETCWSCYRQLFARGRELFAYGFVDLASYWRDYDRLMRHWHARYPARVRDASYEALLLDPEAEIRALLAFCDLPFDPACLDFQSNPRNVGTASAAQVRGPLRRDTAQAPRYGALLDPLRRVLGIRA